MYRYRYIYIYIYIDRSDASAGRNRDTGGRKLFDLKVTEHRIQKDYQ